ncbi:MAG: helix-turn-helix transcriptional regulator [Kiritimatiellae bacterium]|jgi:AraC-like DNA-binding protein|nr:helix-turn-helix transcriptional regulator [Kiritimatiellia bacterium]
MNQLDVLLSPPSDIQRFEDYIGGITLGRNVPGYPIRKFIHMETTESNKRLPLRVLFAGSDCGVEGVYRTTRERDILAIEYVESGRIAFRQDAHEYLVQPNELMLVQPLCKTTWAIAPPDEAKKLVVALTGSLLGEIIGKLGLHDIHHMVPPSPGLILNRLRGIYDMLAAPGRDTSAISAAAYELLIAITNEHEFTDQPEVLRKAMILIEERLHSSLSLEELVIECAQSESSLRRLFNEHVGCSPITYYLRRKTRFAQHLLCNTNLSVKEICYNLGYRDPL